MTAFGVRRSAATILDRCCLAGMGVGVCLLLQPWWSGGFPLGFWLTLCCTVGQIVTSHLGTTNDERRTTNAPP